jgi:beta-1,4-N-acetylglucosaminyltransferase
MKICLICSPGGHLIESLKLVDAFKPNELFLITYKENFDFSAIAGKNTYLIKNLLVKRVDSSKIVKYIYLVISMLFLTFKEFLILLKEKPDIIISTGSEIAIPAFYIAKFLRKKTIFIESLTRISELSGTGKIVYPITDVFLVQWEDLAKRYKKSIYKGNILSSIKYHPNVSKGSFIFVTVGTASFERLVTTIDNISEHINEKILVQIGRTEYEPKNVDFFRFTKDLNEFNELNENAKIIISHAGIGNVMNALDKNKPLIILPRRKKYKEVIDDHQVKMAKSLEKFPLVKVAYREDEILNILKKIDFNETKEKDYESYYDDRDHNLLIYLKETLKAWSSETNEN